MKKETHFPCRWALAATFRAVPVMILALAGTAVHASTIVVPGANTATAGNGGLATPLNTLGRTYQMQIAASQLAGIPTGDYITGLSWRLYSGATSNGSGTLSWADYEITLSQAANTIAGMGTNFANNVLNPVLVHDGTLDLDLSGFSAAGGGGAVKPFAPFIGFSTPYVYSGGDLVLTLTHTASTGSGTVDLLDALTTGAAGYGTDFKAFYATSYQATTSTSSQFFTITEFQFSSTIPEPGSLALFGVGLAANLAARRRKATQA